MNETELQDALKMLLEEIAYMDADDRGQFGVPDELADIENVITFADAGLMTNNAGVVLKLGDGSEFQVTIVQSRY